MMDSLGQYPIIKEKIRRLIRSEKVKYSLEVQDKICNELEIDFNELKKSILYGKEIKLLKIDEKKEAFIVIMEINVAIIDIHKVAVIMYVCEDFLKINEIYWIDKCA